MTDLTKPKNILPYLSLLVILINAVQCLITQQPSIRIVAGYDCNPKTYPFFAHITITIVDEESTDKLDNFTCGGSLVAPNWVLTAAHCCVAIAGDYVVRTGLDTFDGKSDRDARVVSVHRHPKYNATSLNYDACLLKLNRELCVSERTNYTDVVFANSSYRNRLRDVCDDVVGLGYGATYRSTGKDDPQYNYPFPKSTLQCTKLKLLPDFECKHYWKDEFDELSMMCAVDPTPRGGDVCYGDSGGPLMCGDALIGLTSFSKGCGVNNTPGVFTNVPKLKDFVLENIMTTLIEREMEELTGRTNNSSNSNYFLSFRAIILIYIHILTFPL